MEHGFGIGEHDSFDLKRVDNYSIVKIGPEFALGRFTTLHTAAWLDLNQDGKLVDTKEASLFISFSTAF